VQHDLQVVAGPEEVARAGADLVVATIQTAVSERGGCAIALSGGRTPWQMLGILATLDLPWEAVWPSGPRPRCTRSNRSGSSDP
jgi:6-phosphogluconolactonase